jgi:APA family basic amino acid/polyamine antiporter
MSNDNQPDKKTGDGDDKKHDLCPKPPTIFAREATGLVKSLTALDLFNVAFGQVMPAVGIVFIVSFAAYAYTGSNMFYGFLLGIPIIGFGPALLYALLSAAMPRSGGDYVYNSRAINPAIGFMSNFVFTVVVLGFIGTAATLFPSEFFNVFLSTVGQVTNNSYLVSSSSWFATQTGEAVTGTVMVVGIGLLTMYGRSVWKFMKVLFVLVMIGTVVNIVFLAITPHSAFLNAFNSKYPGEYNTVISTAESQGWVPGFTAGATVLSLVYVMASFTGFNFSVYSGGEARKASRSLPISVIGSLIVGGLLFAFWAYGIYHVFGYNFYSAANYLYTAGKPLPFIPLVNYLFTLIPQNPLVEILGALAFGLAWLWLVPTDFIPIIRNMFAWSFDRVAPEKLSYVSEKTHTPIYATLFTIIVGELLTLFFIYTSVSVAFANTEILLNIAFFVTSIAGILFPFRVKDVFEQAPSFVKAKFMGFPVISIVGIYSAFIEAFLIYAGFANPLIGGAPASYPIAVGIVVLGFAIYYIAKWYRLRQGIDLTLVYKVLPPE